MPKNNRIKKIKTLDCTQDFLRWRSVEKELPNNSSFYLVSFNQHPLSISCDYFDHLNGEWDRTKAKYWRPIGPLPSEGGE